MEETPQAVMCPVKHGSRIVHVPESWPVEKEFTSFDPLDMRQTKGQGNAVCLIIAFEGLN